LQETKPHPPEAEALTVTGTILWFGGKSTLGAAVRLLMAGAEQSVIVTALEKFVTVVVPSRFTLTSNANPSVVSVVNAGSVPAASENMLKARVLPEVDTPSGELKAGPDNVKVKKTVEPYVNPWKTSLNGVPLSKVRVAGKAPLASPDRAGLAAGVPLPAKFATRSDAAWVANNPGLKFRSREPLVPLIDEVSMATEYVTGPVVDANANPEKARTSRLNMLTCRRIFNFASREMFS